MPISLARKLQALRVLRFEQLRFRVHRVALIPEQVRELGLPSTPLKATERRAEDWQAAMGIEQTEIDALLSLDPGELERMARAAIDPYYDKDLDLRVFSACSRWLGQAQEALERQLDQDQLDRLRDRAADRLAELRAEITAINDALRIDPDDVELPEIIVPEAVLDEKLHGLPLIDSRWSFVAQTRRLIDAKNYGQPKKKTRDRGDRR
jgi:hypothetical protein